MLNEKQATEADFAQFEIKIDHNNYNVSFLTKDNSVGDW